MLAEMEVRGSVSQDRCCF